jgi:hypothetical protein
MGKQKPSKPATPEVLTMPKDITITDLIRECQAILDTADDPDLRLRAIEELRRVMESEQKISLAGVGEPIKFIVEWGRDEPDT